MILQRLLEKLGFDGPAQSLRRLYLEDYVFPAALEEKFAARHPLLTPSQRDLVFETLRDYFVIRHQTPKTVAMPSRIVDEAWQQFILFTQEYADFCHGAFGKAFPHAPPPATPSPTGLKRAWRLACEREAIDPEAPCRLPRLFALDAQFDVPNGFHYDLTNDELRRHLMSCDDDD